MFDEYRRVRKLKMQADLILHYYPIHGTRAPQRGVIIEREKRLYAVLGTSVRFIRPYIVELTIYFREIFQINKNKKINKTKCYGEWE